METTVSAAGLAGSGMMGFHFFYQGQLRAINPYGTNGPSYLNGTWNYWGCFRFKGEGQVSGNVYRMTVQRMTFDVYNHSATKRYYVGNWNNIPSSATHTTASQMNFVHEIQEDTFSGGGGGGTYNFYYNGSNVGSNTTGGILTVGSLRYTMGSSVGNNQYQIKVEQQQTSGGSGTDWHDLSANPGRDDPRRTDTPSGSANAGNSLGKSTSDFKALHHHHPFQFSDDSSSAGVTVSTAGSSGYGQGINSYGATLDEFSTLSFTLDNRPAYLELCYICKL